MSVCVCVRERERVRSVLKGLCLFCFVCFMFVLVCVLQLHSTNTTKTNNKGFGKIVFAGKINYKTELREVFLWLQNIENNKLWFPMELANIIIDFVTLFETNNDYQTYKTFNWLGLDR